MGAMDLINPRIAVSRRAEILSYASDLVDPAERGEPAIVARAAAPLLEWADSAHDKADLDARMHAMCRAHENDQARLRATQDIPGRTRLTPEEFLARARDYYALIAGSTACPL